MGRAGAFDAEVVQLIKLVRQLEHWRRRRSADEELREEMEAHRLLIQADLESRGMAPRDADAGSRRAMGNVTLARDDARDVWIVRAVDSLWRDTRHALRALRRERIFALGAMLTLAVGVATTTTVFSVVDAELWKPLPYPDSERLVAVTLHGPDRRGPAEYVSGSDFLDLSSQSRSFASLSARAGEGRRVLQRATAEPVMAFSVTTEYFTTLGVNAMRGRMFVAGDGPAGAALVTEGGWRRLFAADPGIVGRAVSIDGQPRRIVGVLRRDRAAYGGEPDFYLAVDDRAPEFTDRTGRAVTAIIGRLRPGVDAAGAQAELQTIADRTAQAYPEGRTGRVVRVEDLRRFYTGSSWRPLYFALGASLIVLLLACANVAGLLLARALRRQREFAIRSALGGGLPALVQQLVVEGALLALPAAGLALLLTHWALGGLATVTTDYLLWGASMRLDARVAAFALCAATFTVIVFGLIPPLVARRADLKLAIGDGGRTVGAAPAQSVVRQALLVAQIAMTLVLLAGAGLFLKSYASLLQVPTGFEGRDRVSLRVSLSGPRYRADEPIRAYARMLLERARAIPGVQAAAVSTSSPLISGPMVRFTGGAMPSPAPGEEPRAILRATTPGFFELLGMRVVRGREFEARDTAGAPRVALVNEFLAGQLFAGIDPVGQRLTLLTGARAAWTRRPGQLTIVGVVSNAKEIGLHETGFSDIYVPFAQAPASSLELIVHGSVPPATFANDLRRTAAEVDPNMPVGNVIPLQRRVTDALRGDRFHLLLVGVFAAVAVVLSAIGIYGAVAYAAEQRRREFGVRLALGASPAGLMVTALREALRVGIIGGVAGVGIGLVLARLLGNSLYFVPGEHMGLLHGVQTSDPVVLGSAFCGLLFVAATAGLIPARRVARLDPLIALREE